MVLGPPLAPCHVVLLLGNLLAIEHEVNTVIQPDEGRSEVIARKSYSAFYLCIFCFLAAACTSPSDPDLNVAVPPTIVFDMEASGGRHIFRAALDGRDVVRLTQSGSENFKPTAVGSKVVFTSRPGGQLRTVPLNGGGMSQVTDVGGSEIQDAALSPNGQRLAFVRLGGDGHRLWTASATGSNAARATDETGWGFVVEAGPSWAPDGNRIVYAATYEGPTKLYILDVATRRVTLFLEDPETHLVSPAWSPDGNWVAFVSNKAGSSDIYRIHVGTRQVERLTSSNQHEIQPDWLPDGRLVFAVVDGNQSRLRWMDPANPAEIHEIPLPGNPRNPRAVR